MFLYYIESLRLSRHIGMCEPETGGIRPGEGRGEKGPTQQDNFGILVFRLRTCSTYLGNKLGFLLDLSPNAMVDSANSI